MGSFRLGDTIIDRLQFGYAAKSNGTPLYVLTNLQDTSIDITADSSDVTDAQGNLVYRKYTGKSGEVSGTNAFLNFAIVSALSAVDAEIATEKNGIVMPIITTVDAGKTLDITNYVEGTVVVSGLSQKGSLGAEYALGAGDTATETEFIIKTEDGVSTLTPPTSADEVQYIVKYQKTVYSGTKIVNSADKFATSHELFFKALAVDPCDKENFKAVVVHIPSFMPSPEFSISLAGGDSQTMDFSGAMMVDSCSTDKVLFELYFIDENEAA
jgi:hypothetical protein